MRCVIGVMLMLLIQPAALPEGDVTFEPPTAVVRSMEEPVDVRITRNGTPVSAGAIGAVRLLVEDHDYSRMLRVERVEGGLRLTPTPLVEIGTYDLVVEVDGAQHAAEVRVTLDEDPNSLANRARAQGLTELDVRHQLGLYTEGPKSVRIDLPEWYYVGKRVQLNMPTPTVASYEWYVNGNAEARGTGPHRFEYPLTAPGTYDFRYVETHSDSGTIESRAQTEAREEPLVPVTGNVGRAVRLVGPAGYTGYTWLIDGEYAAETREFAHRFSETGEYEVTCIATGNAAVEDEAFRKVRFGVVMD